MVALLGLGACGDESDAPSAPTKTTSAYSTTDVSTPENSEQGQLTNVTVGKHDGFTRVVFTFSNLVPGYAVKNAEPPFTQDGSGNVVKVEGVSHLSVRLTARAHDDGKPTLSTKRIAGPSGGTVTEVVPLGDFEGVVNYVIGTSDTSGFRVLTLASPARVAVDIAARA